MNSLFQNIQYKFKNGTIVEKTIYINILVFIAMHAINVFAFLFNSQENYLYNWFSMPADLNLFILRPWSLITYGFLHSFQSRILILYREFVFGIFYSKTVFKFLLLRNCFWWTSLCHKLQLLSCFSRSQCKPCRSFICCFCNLYWNCDTYSKLPD
jgi:hypothetical protein